MTTATQATANGSNKKGLTLADLGQLLPFENTAQENPALPPIATPDPKAEKAAKAKAARAERAKAKRDAAIASQLPIGVEAKATQAKATQAKATQASLELEKQIDLFALTGKTAIFAHVNYGTEAKPKSDVYALYGDSSSWRLVQVDREKGLIDNKKFAVADLAFCPMQGVEFVAIYRDVEFLNSILNKMLFTLRLAISDRGAAIADRLFAVCLLAMLTKRGKVDAGSVRLNPKADAISSEMWTQILAKAKEEFKWFSPADTKRVESALKQFGAIK